MCVGQVAIVDVRQCRPASGGIRSEVFICFVASYGEGSIALLPTPDACRMRPKLALPALDGRERLVRVAVQRAFPMGL